GPELARGLEHGEGLADPRRGTEKELEAAASLSRLFLLRPSKKGLGVGPLSRHGDPPPSIASQCIERPRGSARLEERVLKGDAQRVLRARGRLGAEVLQAERIAARLVVAVLELAHESAPDLVLDGRGDP